MTAAEALQEGEAQLARREAAWLVDHLLGTSPAQRLAHPQCLLSPSQVSQFRALVARRLAGEPLAYLLGHWEFWSLDLLVTPAVLIPRPETELLVEQALARIPRDAPWSLADLGTGSGAIALALAKERPRCLVTAVDNSPAALAIAKANGIRLGLTNVIFLQGDWCAPLLREYHLIVANPPYVAADDPHLTQEGLPWEPSAALTPGMDGLAALSAIAHQARIRLRPLGWLLLEHGYDQGEAVHQCLTDLGYRGLVTYTDLEGRPRVTGGQIEN